VGGTWYWNRYPGARCDSESHSYCYHFSDELVQGWEWSERYPSQPEILRYLNYAADKLDLKRDITFGARVVAAQYDEAANLWRVRTEQGAEYAARYLITAVGCLSSANLPKIDGIADFQGKWYHTGEWPHEGVDFSGKRVGVIGTGSTGIQAIPVIAAAAKHLTVFQRTANYSIPARNAPLTDDFKKYVRENFAEIRDVMRSTVNGHPWRIADRSVFDVSDEERNEIFEKAWEKGGLRLRAEFRDVLTNEEANEIVSAFLQKKIGQIVQDPAKAAILADIDHGFGTKRPPIDTGYFETYNRDNVALVNLRAEPIERITATGVKTSKGEYPLDIIVFATGFDAMTGPLFNLNIAGRDGLGLRDVWREGPRSYLGLQVVGFPNLFTVTGPGSPSVLTNMPVAIEQHVEWITRCIADMRAAGQTRIEAKPDAVDDWMVQVQEVADRTLFTKTLHSWYLGANVPGKPRVFMPYIGGMAKYRRICDEVAEKGYEGFALGA
jgi:cation diffusion facilitator CzcD-associated flavoprotein CzcO